jgi:putative lipase involved disintegration of autophagic bodies
MLEFLPVTLQLLLSPILLLLSPEAQQSYTLDRPTTLQTFTLRHEHAIANNSRVVFSDVHPSHSNLFSNTNINFHTIKLSDTKTHIPKSFDAFSKARMSDLTEADLWVQATVPAPNVGDRETLLTLAKMTNNAYYVPDEKGWYSLGPEWGNNVG